MKFDKNSNSMLFEKTEIPDVFFTEYFAEAPADALKVYFYLVFYTKYSNDTTLTSISKSISMQLSDVKKALEYWEEKSLLIKKSNGYNIVSVQELELSKTHNPKVAFTPEEIKERSDEKYKEIAIESINNQYFQGLMSPSWYTDIILWFEKYKFTDDVMVTLFQYCYDRKALHKNYVVAVANSWHKSGVREHSDLMKLLENSEQINKLSKDISKKLRLGRQITIFEEEFIKKWVNEYEYDMKIIDEALKLTVSKQAPSFSYIDAILTDWNNKGLKTLEEIDKYQKEFKELKQKEYKQKGKSVKAKKVTRKQEHEQRKYSQDDFQELYD